MAHRASALVVAWTPSNLTQVSADNSGTCAVANAKVYCWGPNTSGQVGDGTTTARLTPVPVSTSGVLNGKAIVSIDGSLANFPNQFYCALASDGTAYCWGGGVDGRLGNGATSNSYVPVAVSTTGVLAGKTLTKVKVSDHHACGLASGKLYCWGRGSDGRLGNGTTTSSSVPVAVSTTGVLAGKTVTDFDGGNRGMCAIASGAAYCWGFGSNGEMGNGSTIATNTTPVAVSTTGVLAGKVLTKITMGDNHACALDTNGKAYCWGYNGAGQLGNGSSASSSIPIAVDTSGVLAGKTITDIDAGYNNTCVVTSDGLGYCWGGSPLGTTTPYTSTVPVAMNMSGALQGKKLTQVSIGSANYCALADDNQAYCWGSYTGNNTSTYNYTPVLVLAPQAQVSAMSPSYVLTNTSQTITATVNDMQAGAAAIVLVDGVTTTATVSGSTVTFVAPPSSTAGTIPVSITITNPNGQTSVYNNILEYVNPVTPIIERRATQPIATNHNSAWFTLAFSNDIVDSSLTASDLQLGATTGAVTALTKIDETHYEFEVTGMTDGDTVTVSLPAQAVQDTHGFPNLVSAGAPDNVVIYDTTAPHGFAINVDVMSPGYSIDHPLISFSTTDDFSGMDRYEVSVDGSAFSPQADPYTPTLTPAASHTIIVRAYDKAGNVKEKTVSYPPTISILAPTTLKNSVITDTVISIGGPSGMVISNVDINGAGSSGFSCGALPATVPVICSGGTIATTGTLEVAATTDGGVIRTNSQDYVIDTVAPTAQIARGGGQAAETTVNQAVFEISLSELTQDLTAQDITIRGSATATVKGLVKVSPQVWRVTIGTMTPGDRVSLLLARYTDLAGNSGAQVNAPNQSVLFQPPLLPAPPNTGLHSMKLPVILAILLGIVLSGAGLIGFTKLHTKRRSTKL